MAPMALIRGHALVEITGGMNLNFFTIIDSPLGELLLLSDGQNLTGLYTSNLFKKDHDSVELSILGARAPHPLLNNSLPVFHQTRKQLDEYFNHTRNEFQLPLKLEGTPFQKRVWQELLKIEYGKCTSYGEISRRIGSPTAFRAVGTAIGRNPICLIVPCHRVIAADGSLSGFAGGIERKKFLLDLESQHAKTKQLELAHK